MMWVIWRLCVYLRFGDMDDELRVGGSGLL